MLLEPQQPYGHYRRCSFNLKRGTSESPYEINMTPSQKPQSSCCLTVFLLTTKIYSPSGPLTDTELDLLTWRVCTVIRRLNINTHSETSCTVNYNLYCTNETYIPYCKWLQQCWCFRRDCIRLTSSSLFPVGLNCVIPVYCLLLLLRSGNMVAKYCEGRKTCTLAYKLWSG